MSTTMKKALASAKKVMHPNSRKSKAIMKKTKKITNREKTKLGHAMKQNLNGEKILWMKEHMVADVTPYTPELAAELLQKYISRNDEELDQIELKHSIGGRTKRQHASREDIIRMTKNREQNEYDTCGIEIPDIFNAAQCEMLRKWNGELRYLHNFKFVRFGKNRLMKAELNSRSKKNSGKSLGKSLGENETGEDEKDDEKGVNITEDRISSMDLE